jgi:nitric oxide reductase NorE protein
VAGQEGSDSRPLPGNPLIWVLIVSELLVFAIGLAGFLAVRMVDPAGFSASARLLHAGAGTAATALLLTSGFLAARALHASRRGITAQARLALGLAALLGIAFLTVKGLEYADLLALGVSFEDNTFFTLYMLITGFHAAHVVFGVAVLLLVALRPLPTHVEPAAQFWHMVDLVWVLVFPVIYLVPR